MAAAVVAAPSSTTKSVPIIAEKLRPASFDATTRPSFDPSQHLNLDLPPNFLTLKDIDIPEDAGICSLAVSEPFSLFTEEAVRIMRNEIFTNEVWDNCLQSSESGNCQLRGHCPKYAPFMYEAWKNPKTLSIMSKIAGVDVVPAYDLEIGHINVSVQNKVPEETKKTTSSSDELPVVNWHVDSFSLVCVVMMSDTTDMIGGETAVRTGSGKVLKIRSPQMGSAIILQGRCISHQALAAVGGKERITMCTPFRPRDPLAPDHMVLTTVRPISKLSDLYYQWTKYRIEVLQQRLKSLLMEVDQQHDAGQSTDALHIKNFLKDQMEYMSVTESEMVV